MSNQHIQSEAAQSAGEGFVESHLREEHLERQRQRQKRRRRRQERGDVAGGRLAQPVQAHVHLDARFGVLEVDDGHARKATKLNLRGPFLLPQQLPHAVQTRQSRRVAGATMGVPADDAHVEVGGKNRERRRKGAVHFDMSLGPQRRGNERRHARQHQRAHVRFLWRRSDVRAQVHDLLVQSAAAAVGLPRPRNCEIIDPAFAALSASSTPLLLLAFNLRK